MKTYGRSLMPLIENPKADWDDRFTFFHIGRWGKKNAPGRWGTGDTDPDKAKYKGFATFVWEAASEEQLYHDEQTEEDEKNLPASSATG